MSDFFGVSKLRIARKLHRCTYCGEGITAGEEYIYQKGNYDGHWFESKLHHECFDDLCDGDGEFIPYSNERPVRAIDTRTGMPVLEASEVMTIDGRIAKMAGGSTCA